MSGETLPHAFPSGFHRIRYYGLFANRHRAANLELCRERLGVVVEPVDGNPSESAAKDEVPEPEGWEERMLWLTGIDPTRG